MPDAASFGEGCGGGTMRTREIPRTEWVSFCNNFSRSHEGWGVTLEVFGSEIGDQIEERALFLAGLTAEVSERGDHVAIMLGGKPAGHVTRQISAPTAIELELGEDGTNRALQIKSADGTATLLRLD
jgi:hypothetical protein